MLRFLSQAAKVPVETFASCVEAMARAVRDLRGIFNQTLDSLMDGGAAGAAQASLNAKDQSAQTEGGTDWSTDEPSVGRFSYPEEVKGDSMYDGDNCPQVKHVEFIIIFDKYDNEYVLASGFGTIQEPADDDKFDPNQLCAFFDRAERGHEIAARDRLIEAGFTGIVDAETGKAVADLTDRENLPKRWIVPERDRQRYFSVKRIKDLQVPRREKDYDRQMVEGIRDISKGLGGIQDELK